MPKYIDKPTPGYYAGPQRDELFAYPMLAKQWRAYDAIDGRHGVLTNGATVQTSPSGYSVQLDGTNDFIDVPYVDNGPLDLIGDFSLTGVVTSHSISTRQAIAAVSSTSGSSARWLFEIFNSKLRFFYTASVNPAAVGATNMSSNQPHHVAFTYSTAGGAKVYLDGNLDGLNASAGTLSQPAADELTIGILLSTLLIRPFDGWISYASYHNKVLSAPEIRRMADDPWRAWRRPSMIPMFSGLSFSATGNRRRRVIIGAAT